MDYEFRMERDKTRESLKNDWCFEGVKLCVKTTGEADVSLNGCYIEGEATVIVSPDDDAVVEVAVKKGRDPKRVAEALRLLASAFSEPIGTEIVQMDFRPYGCNVAETDDEGQLQVIDTRYQCHRWYKAAKREAATQTPGN